MTATWEVLHEPADEAEWCAATVGVPAKLPTRVMATCLIMQPMRLDFAPLPSAHLATLYGIGGRVGDPFTYANARLAFVVAWPSFTK